MKDKRLKDTMAYDEILKAMDKQEIGLFDAWKELDMRKTQLKDFIDFLDLEPQFSKGDFDKALNRNMKKLGEAQNEYLKCDELSGNIAATMFNDFTFKRFGRFGTDFFKKIQERFVFLDSTKKYASDDPYANGTKKLINDCLAFLEELKKAL